MSAAEPILTAELLPARATASGRWQRWETWLEGLSDRLNPILVKETRQSLKSTQFALTFFLLLAGGWLWSIFGVVANSPAIYYRPYGQALLGVYYVGLAFPLLVIVPFVAFRSVVGEREDGTYELLSISTLKPRQIIGGKLGSALLQMLIYLSALSPCIAFTYLLRGVDIVTIAVLLAGVVGLSVLLASAGLLIGTVTRVRHWNTVLSVFIILGLMFVYWGFAVACIDGMFRGNIAVPSDMAEFWFGVAAVATAGVGYVVLLLTAAAARITFKSENRSTPLRWVMLGLQGLAVAWFFFFAMAYEFYDSLLGLCVWSIIHWVVFGLFINGETAFLSDRVRRRLPQSFLGRLLFTWMNPGPRTGYIFVCSALAAVMLLTCLVMSLMAQRFQTAVSTSPLVLAGFATVSWAYVAIYLGLGNWLVALGRKLLRIDMITAAIVQPLLLFCGVMAPLMLQLGLTYNGGYTMLQISNPFWTLIEILNSRGSGYFALGVFSPLALLIVAAGVVVFLAHLVGALRDITFERLAAPQRVLEEERRLAPAVAEAARTSPWDDTASEPPRG